MLAGVVDAVVHGHRTAVPGVEPRQGGSCEGWADVLHAVDHDRRHRPQGVSDPLKRACDPCQVLLKAHSIPSINTAMSATSASSAVCG